VTSNRKGMRRGVLVVLVGAVLLGPLGTAASQAAPRPTLDQVRAELAQLNSQAEIAQEKRNQAQVDEATGQRNLVRIQARVARSQAAVDLAQRAVGWLAAAAYRAGGLDQTVQLVMADNPTQFLEQLAALDNVTVHQSDALRTAMLAEQRLAQDRLAVAQQLAQLRQLAAAAAAAYAQVQEAQARTTALLSSLQASQRAALARAAAQARADAAAAAAAARAQVAAQARVAAAAAAAAAARAQRAKRAGAGPPKARPKPAHSTHQPKPQPKPGPTGGGPRAGSIGARVVAWALARVGDAYVWGGAGPSAFDCSGLTMRAYQTVGISLPHSAAAQFDSGRHIATSQLQPGDLVFYYSPIHHVGIYIGGGMIVNAENPEVGVTVVPLLSMPYDGAVRPY
jgi:peptidoglycan DL-endopeptidase CwlO